MPRFEDQQIRWDAEHLTDETRTVQGRLEAATRLMRYADEYRDVLAEEALRTIPLRAVAFCTDTPLATAYRRWGRLIPRTRRHR